jgi:hypothetical protein
MAEMPKMQEHFSAAFGTFSPSRRRERVTFDLRRSPHIV